MNEATLVSPDVLAWWNDQLQRMQTLVALQKRLYPHRQWTPEEAKALALTALEGQQ